MSSSGFVGQGEVRMGRLCATDARRLMAENPVILVPMGSHEDQGPHQPMGDYLLADRIAEIAADRAQAAGTPTFVAPVIPYGGEDFFRSAIGGIVLRQSTMTRLLQDLLGSLIDNGLTRIIFVNGHGGNSTPIFLAARETHRERGVTVPNIYLWEAAYALLPSIVGQEAAVRRAGHGSDPLGSVAKLLFPELVHEEYVPEQRALRPDPLFGLPFTAPGRAMLGDVPFGLPNEYQDIFNDGVASGDPRLSDPETGRVIVDRLTAAIADMAALMMTHA